MFHRCSAALDRTSVSAAITDGAPFSRIRTATGGTDHEVLHPSAIEVARMLTAHPARSASASPMNALRIGQVRGSRPRAEHEVGCASVDGRRVVDIGSHEHISASVSIDVCRSIDRIPSTVAGLSSEDASIGVGERGSPGGGTVHDVDQTCAIAADVLVGRTDHEVGSHRR